MAPVLHGDASVSESLENVCMWGKSPLPSLSLSVMSPGLATCAELVMAFWAQPACLGVCWDLAPLCCLQLTPMCATAAWTVDVGVSAGSSGVQKPGQECSRCWTPKLPFFCGWGGDWEQRRGGRGTETSRAAPLRSSPALSPQYC